MSEALDEIEVQLNYAQPFINGALETVREARRIPNLPGYMDERLARLIWDIEEKFGRLKGTIASARKTIPEGAIETERDRTKHGSTHSLL